MKIKQFETWKIYQASSLGDINKKRKTKGNHPFIYLGQHADNPYKAFGIMLTTKNKELALMILTNGLGNNIDQNIILDNIGYISNEDITGVWKYKVKGHATISIDTRKKIINICNLKVSEKTEIFPNFSLEENNVNYNHMENVILNGIKDGKYAPSYLIEKQAFEFQLDELKEWIKDLQAELEILKTKIKKT